jgi:probable HAF family extracellular repeat protein
MNSSGEVVGQSTLGGNQSQSVHPFLWNGSQMLDLGTLGGTFGSANWINEAGHVVGFATTPGDATVHGVLWENGTMLDLGTAPGQTCSVADVVNTHDQVVGGSCDPQGLADGWLWEHGTLYDLNSLVAPSAVRLGEAHYLNDRGEIVCRGVLANGNVHIMLLAPSALAASEGLTSNVPAGSPPRAHTSDAHADLSYLLHASRFGGYYSRPG